MSKKNYKLFRYFNNVESILMKLMMVIIAGLLLLIIYMIYTTIINSAGTGGFEKSDYISILNTLLSSFIGLIGNLITLWGGYYLFLKGIEKDENSKEEIKKFHMENLSKTLSQSLRFTERVAIKICTNCKRYMDTVDEAELEIGHSREVHPIIEIFFIHSGNHERTLLQKNILGVKMPLILPTDSYNYEDIAKYFTLRQREAIKKWFSIMNTEEFKSIHEVCSYLEYRDAVIRILLVDIDDKYKKNIPEHFYEKIKDTKYYLQDTRNKSNKVS